jgi:NTP pyrophosphatase (non-canonical NTP hydrolase)
MDTIENLNTVLKEFAVVRDWEKFHSPKNLSMALIVEAAELVEHFQWLTEEQSYKLSKEKHQEVGYEMADILLYLIRLSERLDIDLIAAAEGKVKINEKRYPADKVRGSAKKHSDYEEVEGDDSGC